MTTYNLKSSEDFPIMAQTGDIAFVQSMNKTFQLDRSGWHELTEHVWVNGVLKSDTKIFYGSGVVANGAITFYLTDTGDANGNAIFSNVYTESMNLFTLDLTNQYQFGNLVISNDKKTLTLTINKLGSVLIGIIQFVAAANGQTVYLQVKGD